MRILIVDDEEVNRLMIEELLKNYFNDLQLNEIISITKVKDGKEALEYVDAKKDYDLIFMDVMMPIVDGFEATRQIRMMRLDKQPIIIMITALDDTESVKEGVLSGANWYLTKPVNFENLEILINDIVAGKLRRNKEKRVLNKRVLKAIKEKKEIEKQKNFDEEFIDFDSDFDEFEVNFEYLEDEKLSAIEFMKIGVIDTEDIHDFQEYLDEFLYAIESSKDELKQKAVKVLESVSRVLNNTYIFRNLAYGIEVFMADFKNYKLDDLDDIEYELFKSIIECIVLDFKKWVDEVLIEQTALDVHYLDSSILSNVAQLDIMLKNKL